MTAQVKEKRFSNKLCILVNVNSSEMAGKFDVLVKFGIRSIATHSGKTIELIVAKRRHVQPMRSLFALNLIISHLSDLAGDSILARAKLMVNRL